MSLPVASKIRGPRRANIVTSARSQQLVDCLAAVNKASNCRCVEPRVGAFGGDVRAAHLPAGECSRTPSITRVR
jgi:hypothetical protein